MLPRPPEAFEEDDEQRKCEPEPRSAQRHDLAGHHQRHGDGLGIAHVAVGATCDEVRRRVERERRALTLHHQVITGPQGQDRAEQEQSQTSCGDPEWPHRGQGGMRPQVDQGQRHDHQPGTADEHHVERGPDPARRGRAEPRPAVDEDP